MPGTDPHTAASCDTEWQRTFVEYWMRIVPETRDAIVGLLPDAWSFEGKRVLDFGSGPGRTLREFVPEGQAAEFWGVDIDAASIDQLRATLCPPMHAAQCGYWPPLPFQAGSFDLAWAISVFTHLTDNSIPWLLELHRVLRPGGFLIANFMGRWMSELVAGEPWDDTRIGMNVFRHTHPWSEGGPLVLISDWWLREHWGRAFDVLEIAPRIHNSSWALLRKRDVTVTVDDLTRPGNDWREYQALRHNLARAQREIEHAEARLAGAQHEAAEQLAAVRRHYEHSRSWQLTRPLRKAARLVRARRTPATNNPDATSSS
jgi:SAM-dependent methyltransferase